MGSHYFQKQRLAHVKGEGKKKVSEKEKSHQKKTQIYTKQAVHVCYSRLHSFIPDAGPRPLGLAVPRPAWTRLNHLRTSVGCSRSSMHKWGMAPSVICECGMEDQTADHIIQTFQCSPQNGVHGLQVLDEGTIKWLSNTCPNI